MLTVLENRGPSGWDDMEGAVFGEGGSSVQALVPFSNGIL